MRFRTFSGVTIAEAMAEVRAALGPDAVILSTHHDRRSGHVEVIAAAEQAEPEPAPPPPAPFPGGAGMPARADIAAALTFHHLDRGLAAALCRTAEGFGMADPVHRLAAALEARFAFAPLPRQPSRPVMLLGPPGGGKTATLAKLAARGLLAGHEVRVLSADAGRAGGVAQLEAFTRRLECPLDVVRTPEELAHMLAETAPEVMCLIDTPGTNPFAREEIGALTRLARAGDVERVLVLPAGGDGREMAEQAKIFAALGARRLIATRVDVARRLGGLLAAAEGGRLAFAHVSITPYIARGLSPLGATALSRLLLDDPALRASFAELRRAAE